MLRVVVAFLPLAILPLLVHLIANGSIDLGGGEKDLVFVLPWLLWSLLFAAVSLFLWWRGWSLPRSVLRSSLIGLAGLALAGALLAAIGQLGVAGRF